MAKAASSKEIRRFLSERRLTASFNKWQSIKSVRKTKMELVFSNFGVGGRRRPVYVYRDSKGVVVRDYNTLNILARSRRKLKDVVSIIGKSNNKPYYKNIKGRMVKFDMHPLKLKLKDSYSDYSYNSSIKRLREVKRTNTTLKRKVGMVVCDLTIVDKGGKYYREVIRSSADVLTRKNIERLIDECIRNAAGKLGFSPKEVVINSVWFEYWLDRPSRARSVRTRVKA